MAIFSVNVKEEYWTEFQNRVGKGKASKAIQLLLKAYLAGLVQINLDSESVQTYSGAVDRFDDVDSLNAEPELKIESNTLIGSTLNQPQTSSSLVLAEPQLSSHLEYYYQKAKKESFSYPAIELTKEANLNFLAGSQDDCEPEIVMNEAVLFAKNLCCVLEQMDKPAEYQIVQKYLQMFLVDPYAEIPQTLVHPLTLAKFSSEELGL